jgi:hypothetical protein
MKIYCFLLLSTLLSVKAFSQNPESFNRWFRKTTGSNYTFNPSQIKFDTKNYETAIYKFPNLNFGMEDVNGEDLTALRPNVISKIGSVKIIFSGGWTFTYFANANCFITTVHHGSSGDSRIFNLKTGVVDDVDFEVVDLNGDKAIVQTSWHNQGGGYESKSGYYDLNTKKVKYGRPQHY